MRTKKEQLLQNVRQGTVKPERAGSFWEPREREALQRYYAQGVGISEMALLLGRKEMAIIQQLDVMGLFNNANSPRRKRRQKPNPKCPNCGTTLICPICDREMEAQDA